MPAFVRFASCCYTLEDTKMCVELSARTYPGLLRRFSSCFVGHLPGNAVDGYIAHSNPCFHEQLRDEVDKCIGSRNCQDTDMGSLGRKPRLTNLMHSTHEVACWFPPVVPKVLLSMIHSHTIAVLEPSPLGHRSAQLSRQTWQRSAPPDRPMWGCWHTVLWPEGL